MVRLLLAAIGLSAGWAASSVTAADPVDPIPQSQLRTTYRIGGASFLRSFREVVAEPRTWTVRVERRHPKTQRWKSAALGVVVDPSGLILTKASEAEGQIRVRLPDRSGDYPAAEVVATDQANDLAILQIDASDLPPLPAVTWAAETPEVGRWVATPTTFRSPAAVGIISVPERKIPRTELPGMLGVQFTRTVDGVFGAEVERITSDAPADRAGLKPGDVIESVDGERTGSNRAVIRAIQRLHPGDYVRLGVRRQDDSRKVDELRVRLAQPNTELLESRNMRFDMMNGLGGALSERRSNFPGAVQHDSVLDPKDCGGAAVNLDGEAVGINIARAGRTETLMIPAERVRPVLRSLLRQTGR